MRKWLCITIVLLGFCIPSNAADLGIRVERIQGMTEWEVTAVCEGSGYETFFKKGWRIYAINGTKLKKYLRKYDRLNQIPEYAAWVAGERVEIAYGTYEARATNKVKLPVVQPVLNLVLARQENGEYLKCSPWQESQMFVQVHSINQVPLSGLGQEQVNRMLNTSIYDTISVKTDKGIFVYTAADFTCYRREPVDLGIKVVSAWDNWFMVTGVSNESPCKYILVPGSFIKIPAVMVLSDVDQRVYGMTNNLYSLTSIGPPDWNWRFFPLGILLFESNIGIHIENVRQWDPMQETQELVFAHNDSLISLQEHFKNHLSDGDYYVVKPLLLEEHGGISSMQSFAISGNKKTGICANYRGGESTSVSLNEYRDGEKSGFGMMEGSESMGGKQVGYFEFGNWISGMKQGWFMRQVQGRFTMLKYIKGASDSAFFVEDMLQWKNNLYYRQQFMRLILDGLAALKQSYSLHLIKNETKFEEYVTLSEKEMYKASYLSLFGIQNGFRNQQFGFISQYGIYIIDTLIRLLWKDTAIQNNAKGMRENLYTPHNPQVNLADVVANQSNSFDPPGSREFKSLRTIELLKEKLALREMFDKYITEVHRRNDVYRKTLTYMDILMEQLSTQPL